MLLKKMSRVPLCLFLVLFIIGCSRTPQSISDNNILDETKQLKETETTTNETVEEKLKRARNQFFAAIDDEKWVEPTIELFRNIEQLTPEHAGRIQVYIGALSALKGKHAFLPDTKLEWTNSGLAAIDKGLKESPNDIEALFIHGRTCDAVPFFFGRSGDAQRDFKKIIELMPQGMDSYDPELITDIVEFLLENVKLTDDEKTYLQTVKDSLHP
jgi:hypothetical protein